MIIEKILIVVISLLAGGTIIAVIIYRCKHKKQKCLCTEVRIENIYVFFDTY